MIKWYNSFGLWMVLILLIQCNGEPEESSLDLIKDIVPSPFSLLSSTQTGITASNTLSEDEDFNLIEYLYFYNGAGVATADITADGLPELLFATNQLGVHLYRNVSKNDSIHFEDITDLAQLDTITGWSTGVSFVDVNADGKKDIYLCQVGGYKKFKGHNRLLINVTQDVENPKYEDQTEKYGLSFTGFSTHASWFDYDLDGDLDMYLLNHSVHNTGNYGKGILRHENSEKAGDRLYRNDEGKFQEVTTEAGILSGKIGYGLGIAISDLNKDGYPDIYIGNDFHENDYLYINQTDGTFKEVIRDAVGHTSQFTMGVGIADLNGDAMTDIISLDMKPMEEVIIKNSVGHDPQEIFEFKHQFGYHYQYPHNHVQLSQGIDKSGHPYFSEVSHLIGLDASDWSWSPLIADFDNDGDKDIFITNGIVRRPNDLEYLKYLSNPLVQEKASDQDIVAKMPSGKVPNVLFLQGEDGLFTKASIAKGEKEGVSSGAVYVDLDRDGDLDIVTNNINQEATIYQNNVNSGHFIKVPESIVLKMKDITIYVNDQVMYYEAFGQNGFMSSLSDELTIGVGEVILIDSILFNWTKGKSNILYKVEVDKTISIADLNKEERSKKPYSKPFFSRIEPNIDFIHIEDQYNDMNSDKLIPRKYSTEGPPVAIGDVNNDGLADIFFGNSTKSAPSLYIQQSGFQFKSIQQEYWQTQKHYEDTEAHFLDIDDDQDLDLVVGSGGHKAYQNSPLLSTRTYINKNGIFTLEESAISGLNMNTSTISTTENGDNLFLGSNVKQGSFGDNPEHFLFKKTDNEYIKHPLIPNEELAALGQTNDSEWADINGDGLLDLVLVGEWMPITILYQNPDGFQVETLSNTEGFYQCVNIVDMDRDGKLDIVVGNMGRNKPFIATSVYPLKLHYKDFDSNYQKDPVITHYKDNKYRVLAARDELIEQIPVIKKMLPTYDEYAKSNAGAILKKLDDKGSKIKSIKNLETCWYKNEGTRGFAKRDLPIEAQYSVTQDILPIDINGDDILDLVTVGNFKDYHPSFEMSMSSYGQVFLGNGNGTYNYISNTRSGLRVKGGARSINLISDDKGQQYLIIAKNNAAPEFYQLNTL